MSDSGLIRPERSGTALADEIRATAPAPGTLALWWLGQSGFVVKSGTGTLVVDPYLSDSLTRKYAETDRPHVRMTAQALEPGQLTGVDLVLASHKHSDHLNLETIRPLLAANAGAVLVVPEALVAHAVGLGVPAERVVGLDAGGSIERARFRVRAVPAAHEGLDRDAAGRHLYLGFVVECEGRRLYHSGDSLAYPGLVAALGPSPFDVLLLPINGRDPARGVPGNMSAAEAVDLATAVRPRYVVPHHYDMFAFNTAPASAFEVEALRLPGGVQARVLRCGQRWEISP